MTHNKRSALRRAPFLFLAVTVPSVSRNRPAGVLSNPARKWDNYPMNELIKTLQQIGLPVAEIERVKRYYKDDLDGLRQYVLYMRAMFDDRHEYMA